MDRNVAGEDATPGELDALRARIADCELRLAESLAAERLLRRQAQALDAIGEAVIITDLDGAVTHWNDAAVRLYGWSAADALGRPVMELAPSQLQDTAAANIAGVLAGQRWSGEFPVLRRDGSSFLAQITVAALVDEAGRVVGTIGISSDISARRRSEDRFRALFEQSLDAILIFDEGGACVQANPAACRLLGLRPEQVAGRRVADLLGGGLAPGGPAPAAGDAGGAGELLLRGADGELRVAEYSWSGVVPGLAQCILRDVTARRRAESQSREQLQAVAVLRERERLARELHTSVGQVLGYIDLQARAVRDFIAAGRAAMAAASLGSLLAVVEEMQQDVQAYILGTLAEQRLTDPRLEGDDLVAAVRQQAAWVEALYGLRVDLEVDAGLAPDALSPLAGLQLTRILQEALSNVHKHAGVHDVRVSLGRSEGLLQLVIADQGRGFEQAVADMPVGGFGLLSMRSRAAEIGGQLTIATAAGAGTAVRVEVPLGLPARALVAGPRVLLVDERSPFVELLRPLLAARGFGVVGVASGRKDALTRARAARPDVIILDIDSEQTEADGMATLEALHAELPEIQVVVLAAAEDEHTIFEALRRGAAGYLPKGPDAAALGDQLVGLARGEAILPPALALRLLRELAARADDAPEVRLSDQQIRVLTLLAQGMTYKAIGRALGYSERAIKYQTGNAIKTLGLRDRAAAQEYARRQLWRGAWPAPPREPDAAP